MAIRYKGGVKMYPNLMGQKAYHKLTTEQMGAIIGLSRQSYETKMESGRFTPEECILNRMENRIEHKGRNTYRRNREAGNEQKTPIGHGIAFPFFFQTCAKKEQKGENGKRQHQRIHGDMKAENVNGTKHSFPL